MTDIAAIVEPAIDIRQLSRDIAREHIALQDADRKVEVNATQGESLRKKQAEHRLEMGRLLIEAKKQVPHGGWLLFLRTLGILVRSAQDWTDLAKHVCKLESVDVDSNLPTQRDVKAARREPEPVGDEPDDQDDEPDETKPDPPARKPTAEKAAQVIDLSQALTKIMTTASDLARKSTDRERALIAYNLHETAKLIEEMQ